jgi:hypothetical protein
MMTRHELSVVDFFLDRIAVASPQWDTGLTFLAIAVYCESLEDEGATEGEERETV